MKKMNLLFPFVLFCHWPPGQWYPKLQKRAVSFSSGSQEGEDGSARDPVSTLPSPSPFASGQQGPVRGRDAFSAPPAQPWSRVSVAPHTQTTLRDALPFESDSCAPLHFTYGAFPLHGTARYGSVRFTFGGVSTGYCTWYFFSTTSAEVPSEPYHYQNVTCELC